MKTHTSSFKEQIKLIGKEIDSRITFGDTVLGKDDLNAVTPSYQGAILKSVMKQLDIDSNVKIPIGTILKYEFGLKVNGEYEYINYGNYVVYSIEKQEDTNSYKILCYDKLLYSMLDYVNLPITYPISIRDYIGTLSMALGLNFANNNDEFANYDKQIQADLYDGLGYTFRDVLDELAQVTASTICLNNNDELEIRYITETGDTIDEEFLKDVNVNFGEKFGAVNTIVLSRSDGSDKVYKSYPENLPEDERKSIEIADNQIMNDNDRADFLPDILEKLNGLEFYTNDFVSTGICYYDLCDRYSVKVGDNTYSCVMFNDEVLVTQGLEENVYTELPEQTETDYKHASKDDRMINQVYIIAKKNEAEILAVVNTTKEIQKEINPTLPVTGSSIIIEDASDAPLIELEIEGKSVQDGTPTPDTPVEIESVGYENLFDYKLFGSSSAVDYTYYKNLGINVLFAIPIYVGINKTAIASSNVPVASPGDIYLINDLNAPAYDAINVDSPRTIATNSEGYVYLAYATNRTYYNDLKNGTYWVQVVKDNEKHNYISYGKYGIEVEITNGVEIKTLSIELNQPIRSLPNGVKDKAYIRNNILYVDRYVGSMILNGSENYSIFNYGTSHINTTMFSTTAFREFMKKTAGTIPNDIYSNNFVQKENSVVTLNDDTPWIMHDITPTVYLCIENEKANTVEKIKTWLSIHNTQVDYELAEPYTEEVGKIEMPSTFKDYNNIATTDDLEPIINIEYVRDTVLADYVENHIAELKINEEQISQRVETIDTSVDGLQTDIRAVEQITTDTSQVIKVISKNIITEGDNAGDVTEVTTTTGFTFNKDGMTIDDGSGFKAEHRAHGTYYKDGTSTVGQYTKDGSKQKDLELFGTYSYGKTDIDDTPMFVGQLYTDENGEETFGHFYNGGDY